MDKPINEMTIKREKCPKHAWHKIEVAHRFKPDLAPGGINRVFPNFFVEVCLHCNKVRGWATTKEALQV